MMIIAWANVRSVGYNHPARCVNGWLSKKSDDGDRPRLCLLIWSIYYFNSEQRKLVSLSVLAFLLWWVSQWSVHFISLLHFCLLSLFYSDDPSVQNMLVFTKVALAPFCLCKDDSTLANGPPRESGMEVMVPGADGQPWLGAVPPMPPTVVLACSTDPFPLALTWEPPVGLGPPQLDAGFGLGPGPPVLSGSVALASLLSSSRASDFLPEPLLAAAAAAAAARSCLRNFARLFWNHTYRKPEMFKTQSDKIDI